LTADIFLWILFLPVAIILMGVLSGILGVILAAPIMAVAIVLARTLYIEVIVDGPADGAGPPSRCAPRLPVQLAGVTGSCEKPGRERSIPRPVTSTRKVTNMAIPRKGQGHRFISIRIRTRIPSVLSPITRSF